MIAMLRGEVVSRCADHIVLLCGGVGYRVSVSAQTLGHVPALGGQVTLHTHLISREDGLLLYGFHSAQEKDLFLMLLSVQAIGPKLAIAVLSGGQPRELLAAIAAGNARRFQAVPGIGKRTAERIIVELREKVGHPERASDSTPLRAEIGEDDPRLLAAAGLWELGYTPGEAELLLEGAEGERAEELIADALRRSHRRVSAA